MDGSKRKSESSGSGQHQRKTHKTSQQVDFPCDFDGCRSTFRCQFNLMRHKSSIHGSKRPCPLEGCNYASGRPDKMKEHIKRMHSFVRQEAHQDPPSMTDSSRGPPNYQDNQMNYSNYNPSTGQEMPYNMNSAITGNQLEAQGYQNSGSSSLEVMWNPSHPSFFGEMLFDRLCIDPAASNSQNVPVMEAPNMYTSTSSGESLPCSPAGDHLQGLGGWVGDSGFQQRQLYEYAENETEHTTNTRYGYESNTGYENFGPAPHGNTRNNDSWT